MDHRIVAAPCLRRPRSGQRDRGRRGRRHLWIPLAALAVIVLSHSIAAAPTKEVRRILILNEAGPSYPAINIINQGIQTALHDSPYQLEFYSEYLDTILFPDPATQQEFRDFYIHKYQNRRPDVIITVGPSPLKFMQEVHRRAFPGVPIIFCLPNGNAPGAPELDSDFTGVENDLAAAETLEIALRLQPRTEHVVVTGGVSNFDKQQLAAVKSQLAAFTGRVDIAFVTNLAMPDLLERLRHLPNHTVVIFTSVGQDAAGTRFKSSDTGPMVAAAANAPVFSLFDLYLNHGEVGGYLSSVIEQGRLAGDIALKLFSGEKPQGIPRVRGTATYMFDWRALQRWGFKEKDLPPGSVVLNRQSTVWELYRWYIVGGIALLLLQTLLIFGLVRQRARRRKTETELEITNDRLRRAMEAGKTLGWDWDVKTGRDRWFGDLRTIFGVQSDTYSGHIEDFHRLIHPEDRALVGKAVADARQSRKPYAAEFRVVRPDGSVRWITARGQFTYDANGDAERMLGMSVDITERKLAEGAVEKSEEKFSKAFRESPMSLTVTSLKDHRYIEVNETFEQTTGWRRDEVIGRTPFDLNLWVNPAQRTEMVKEIQTKGTIRNLEFRFRCKDGEQRDALGSAELIEIEGEPCLISVTADITERRQIEQSLRESEERFRLVANTAPVLIWMAGTDKLYNYLNQPWLEFTGRPLEAELGNGWVQGVHPEDLKACLDAYTQAFDGREPFQMEYRLRRHDGEYRWVSDMGVARFNPDHSFAGYIGYCIDVTDRRLATEALTTMSRKLIEAHEEERTWIARELHDDINQRIALSAIELDRWNQHLGSELNTHNHIQNISQRLAEIGKDIQALSHRLHSSKLEYLGIAVAARSFCKELSEQHKVRIDYSHSDIPHNLPKEIALCLFRVLQEALQNAAKHSGVQHFKVELRGTPGEIQLSVIDAGSGFDWQDAINRRGMGLISMRERLQLVNGELSIRSEAGHGTTIYACVPVGSDERRVKESRLKAG
jgi:PAS domain S-box-containing protein